MNRITVAAIIVGTSSALSADIKRPEAKEFITEIAAQRRVSPIEGIPLKGNDQLVTPVSFKPPVEITIVAKTNSTDLRFGYAADQVILRWKQDHGQLRIDGGPADRQYKHAAGDIPVNRFVTIRWVVLPTKQTIYVDGGVRLEHSGDYRSIDNPVSIFPGEGSRVTVKSLKVLQLPPALP